MTRELAVLGIVMLLGVPCRADAQAAELDRAEALYADADFEGALEALDRAELATELDRDALVRLLRLRAFALFAMRDQSRLEAALRALARIGPETLDDAPPRLAAAYVAARGSTRPPRVVTRVERDERAVVVIAEALDVDPLLRRTQVRARSGRGAWLDGDERLRIELPASSPIEYYAVALGPGSAALAWQGTESAPLTLELEAEEGPSGGGGGGEDLTWVALVGGGAALVAAAVIVAVVVVDQSSGGIVLRGPTIEMP